MLGSGRLRLSVDDQHSTPGSIWSRMRTVIHVYPVSRNNDNGCTTVKANPAKSLALNKRQQTACDQVKVCVESHTAIFNFSSPNRRYSADEEPPVRGSRRRGTTSVPESWSCAFRNEA